MRLGLEIDDGLRGVRTAGECGVGIGRRTRTLVGLDAEFVGSDGHLLGGCLVEVEGGFVEFAARVVDGAGIVPSVAAVVEARVHQEPGEFDGLTHVGHLHCGQEVECCRLQSFGCRHHFFGRSVALLLVFDAGHDVGQGLVGSLEVGIGIGGGVRSGRHLLNVCEHIVQTGHYGLDGSAAVSLHLLFGKEEPALVGGSVGEVERLGGNGGLGSLQCVGALVAGYPVAGAGVLFHSSGLSGRQQVELIGRGRSIARDALEAVAVGEVAARGCVPEDVVGSPGVVGYVPGEVVALSGIEGQQLHGAACGHGQEVHVFGILAGQVILLVILLLEDVGRSGKAHAGGADKSVLVEGMCGEYVGIVEDGVLGVIRVLVGTVDAIGPHVGFVAGQCGRSVVLQELYDLVGARSEPQSATGLGAEVSIVVPFARGADAHAVVRLVQNGARLLVGYVLAHAHPATVGAVGRSAASPRTGNVVDAQVEAPDVGQIVVEPLHLVHGRSDAEVRLFVALVVVGGGDVALGQCGYLHHVAVGHLPSAGDGVCAYVIYGSRLHVLHAVDVAVVREVSGRAVVEDGGIGLRAPAEAAFLGRASHGQSAQGQCNTRGHEGFGRHGGHRACGI